MRSGSLKLNKLELLLSLAVVSFIGGPIGYRVYQICNTFSHDSETRATVVRISSSKTDNLALSEYVVINQEDISENECFEASVPQLIDFTGRSFSRLSLCNLQILPAEDSDMLVPFENSEIRPFYPFKENILMFSGLDSSVSKAAAGQ